MVRPTRLAAFPCNAQRDVHDVVVQVLVRKPKRALRLVAEHNHRDAVLDGLALLD